MELAGTEVESLVDIISKTDVVSDRDVANENHTQEDDTREGQKNLPKQNENVPKAVAKLDINHDEQLIDVELKPDPSGILVEQQVSTAVSNENTIIDIITPMESELAVEATDNPLVTTSPTSTATLPGCLTPRSQSSDTQTYNDCLVQLDRQRQNYEQQLEQLRSALTQKENMIALYQRENAILDKEKNAFRNEKELANKEKESTVIKFAVKEKLLLDAKKEKENVEKQLADARKEVKNISVRFQAINEEKSRMTYIIDEKCNEIRKYQRECEKLKTDYGHIESKLKYHVNKLNIETEARMALEKKLEEERRTPNKLEEQANEKLKIEHEANTILLKHEIKSKSDQVDNLTRELNKSKQEVKQLQDQLGTEILHKAEMSTHLAQLQEEHNSVQNAFSEEMLNSAKLRCQLDELQVLRTQNTLNEEKIVILTESTKEMAEKLCDNEQDLQQLRTKEAELLSINQEFSESIVVLQNEICLLKAKAQGIEAKSAILEKEKLDFDSKYEKLLQELKNEQGKKLEERQLFAKHLSEKTKLYEVTKGKLENVEGDFEATKHKHATVIRELQRELQKYKKSVEHVSGAKMATTRHYCTHCHNGFNDFEGSGEGIKPHTNGENGTIPATTKLHTHSRASSQSSQQSIGQHPSDTSDSETVASGATAIQQDLQGPSKKHLVERILRLQQASARQTEKIDFLENHTLSLVAELQKKSKVVQYYMLRDQVGALTSMKSDENKSELSKYGNGVMSAIYNGIKGDTKSMTLDLSLEINRKLQAVLEDTLLKNITLKENLDVLGLEVDNLTRKLRHLESRE